MAVKMRLMRMGKTKSPHYRVVVIDGRAPRDGRYIDLIGRYDPREDPSLIDIDNEKAIDWLKKGAQPTEAVRKILDAAGALTQFKIKSGQIHTVGAKPVPEASATEEAAEEPAAEEPAQETVAEAVAEKAVAEEPVEDTTPAEAADTEPAAAEEE